MKIEKLSVSNFKGIDSLEFEPKSINLILGRNNTGKTSLLEAIDLLFKKTTVRKYKVYSSSLVKVGQTESVISARLGEKDLILKINRPTKEIVLMEIKNRLANLSRNLEDFTKTKFNEDQRKEIEREINNLHLDDDLITELAKGAIALTRNDNQIFTYLSSSSQKVHSAVATFCESLTKNLKERLNLKVEMYMIAYLVFGDVFDTPISAVEVRSGPSVLFLRNTKLNPETVINNEEAALKKHKIEEYLKNYKLLDNLEKFDFDYLLFKFSNETEPVPIPYQFMGDGLQAMVGILWHLSSNRMKGGIVLIEELGNHMHPGYIQQLVKFLVKFSRETNIQFFITSHNSDLIDLLLNDNLSDDEKKYLENELLVLSMEKDYNIISARAMDYHSAKDQIKNILWDLRGI